MASAQHLLDALFNGLVPVISISMIIWGLLWALRPLRNYAGVGGLFALVGATIGLLTGASREAVVQATLPAMIALITGYLGWLLRQEVGANTGLRGLTTTTSDGDAADVRPTVLLVVSAVLGLMLAAAAGTMWGASMREASVVNDRRYEEWRFNFEQQEVLIKTELLRRDLGLLATQSPSSNAILPAEESSSSTQSNQ